MSKIWVVIAQRNFGDPDISAFKEKEKALNFAFKWIMGTTGGPSAWRPDEWPQMRAAIVERDVEAMIQYYNAAVQSDRGVEYILLEQIPLR